MAQPPLLVPGGETYSRQRLLAYSNTTAAFGAANPPPCARFGRPPPFPPNFSRVFFRIGSHINLRDPPSAQNATRI